MTNQKTTMVRAMKIGLAVLLFLCLFEWPYGFYQFVRFVSMLAFGYFAYDAHERGRDSEVWIFVILALLFQPLFKIHLGRILWNVIDIGTGIWLMRSVFFEPTSEDSDD